MSVLVPPLTSETVGPPMEALSSIEPENGFAGVVDPLTVKVEGVRPPFVIVKVASAPALVPLESEANC